MSDQPNRSKVPTPPERPGYIAVGSLPGDKALLFAAVATIIGATIITVIVISAMWKADTIASHCADANNISQECIDYRMDQCMATERYTLDQCVMLVSGR